MRQTCGKCRGFMIDRSREFHQCMDCGHYLSLGPARMTDEARVELRAAELADPDYDVADFRDSEWLGWSQDENYIMCGEFRNVHEDMSEERYAGWNAGWLAREIFAHDATHDGGKE